MSGLLGSRGGWEEEGRGGVPWVGGRAIYRVGPCGAGHAIIQTQVRAWALYKFQVSLMLWGN